MISESGEKGHGEEEAAATVGVSKVVLLRDTVPGVSCIRTVAGRVHLPPVRLPTWVSSVQWAVSIHPLQAPDFRNGGNDAAQDPYAAESLVPSFLPGLRR